MARDLAKPGPLVKGGECRNAPSFGRRGAAPEAGAAMARPWKGSGHRSAHLAAA
ncbi:hypothetical protein [Dinoroseobacter sp. S124A]|uniref:hypothetical protein n=1 Tax=Dinoroseobacter sp. S124A TaxID=3415128 RepID=UPI003C7973A3